MAPVSATPPVLLADGEFRVGTQSGAPEMRSLIGYCEFDSPDAALLVSLLPRLVHVRGEKRLATLVELVREESRNQLPARDVISWLVVLALAVAGFLLARRRRLGGD